MMNTSDTTSKLDSALDFAEFVTNNSTMFSSSENLLARALLELRASTLKSAAEKIEPKDDAPCKCVVYDKANNCWYSYCDCVNVAAIDRSATWCTSKNNALDISNMT
jgi:hypothetical protein